jgi:acyl-coenzyme A synthetase/AMP-(fatty) acid ligase
VRADYLPAPVRFCDRIAVIGEGRFRVLGRMEDQVNIAGHRASLGDLTRKLLEVDGVQDGAFYLPDPVQGPLARLTAVVVAPGKTHEEIQDALRLSMDPVFLPRPLVLVPKLPRNETGKLPREALRRLVEQHSERGSAP